MESRTISSRSDVAFSTTTARVTPTPPRASRFGEVLSSTVVRGAESAMRLLPGSPVMAAAVRGATGGATSVNLPMHTMAGGATTSAVARSPEGPLTSPSLGTGLPTMTSTAAGTSAGGVASGENANVETALQQSQDMNLYFLQIQEQVNAQNRSFTTLSNVLKAEHDTVKTAIGNIR